MATAKETKADGKFAVIQTGGKQYLVKIGETLKIEKIKTTGDSVVFNDVFLVADGDNVKIGNPVVQGVKVTAKVEGDIRGKKITVLKYKPKVRYRVKRGHRQNYTKITIEKIESGK